MEQKKREQFTRLGYVHWPEHVLRTVVDRSKFTRLGYVHWPELTTVLGTTNAEFTRLGYVHWPELPTRSGVFRCSLPDWDMCTGRNTFGRGAPID